MSDAKVFAYTITRANTPSRARLLNSTLTVGRDTADHPFFWRVYVNGRDTLAQNITEAAFATRVVDGYEIYDHNCGQHIPTNDAITRALDEGYDYLLRIDDDVEWQSKRWLAKLIEASRLCDDAMVLSPVVRGLRWQPQQSQVIYVKDIPLKMVEGPLGGICRLTPTSLLRTKPYVSDVRLPMGGGDAAGVGNWAMKGDPLVYLAYCQHIRVRHAKSTDQQERDDPKHFADHGIFQHCPYIPLCE